MRYGKKGNGYMPANAKLQALDVAELVTYMREKWEIKSKCFRQIALKWPCRIAVN